MKRKNETVRSQYLQTRTALFPGFEMQERKLSPLVFLVRDGKVIGHIATGATSSGKAPEKKQGFWSRLFGGGQ